MKLDVHLFEHGRSVKKEKVIYRKIVALQTKYTSQVKYKLSF